MQKGAVGSQRACLVGAAPERAGLLEAAAQTEATVVHIKRVRGAAKLQHTY